MGVTSFMPGSPDGGLQYRMDPGVLMMAYDAYLRRTQEMVLGTLMGYVNENKTVEITNCFIDIHYLSEVKLLQINTDHHTTMVDLLTQVAPDEVVVGWFGIAEEMTELNHAAHIWFKNYPSDSRFIATSALPEPIHVYIEPRFFKTQGRTLMRMTEEPGGKMSRLRLADKENLGFRAYSLLNTTIIKDCAFGFRRAPITIANDLGYKQMLVDCNNRISFPVNAHNIVNVGQPGFNRVPASKYTIPLSIFKEQIDQQSPPPNEPPDILQRTSGLDARLYQLRELLLMVYEYVGGVISDTETGYPDIARTLLHTLDMYKPAIDENVVENLASNTLKDLTLICQLAAHAGTEFALNEKLHRFIL